MRQTYVPDLTNLQLLGELNYRRVNKLLRTQEEQDEWLFEIHTLGGQESRLRLTFMQQSQYTTQLELEFGHLGSSDLLFEHRVKMVVRLYHDVGIAEVTDGHRHYQGSYPYPNDAMLHKDEKFRLNQQLADLLELCLKHGHRFSSEPIYQYA